MTVADVLDLLWDDLRNSLRSRLSMQGEMLAAAASSVGGDSEDGGGIAPSTAAAFAKPTALPRRILLNTSQAVPGLDCCYADYLYPDGAYGSVFCWGFDAVPTYSVLDSDSQVLARRVNTFSCLTQTDDAFRTLLSHASQSRTQIQQSALRTCLDVWKACTLCPSLALTARKKKAVSQNGFLQVRSFATTMC